jgi:putative alpha-1,2-mannosidase
MVRNILDEMYRNDFDGLSGNEDCGQMSAWYILSAMGIYPVNPAEGIYSFGSPVFDEVTIHAGAPFRIVALNNGPENMYIQKATLNGQELDRCYIYHDEILKGGVLQFEMGAEPNTALWTNPDAAPPSMTQ